jgi:antitoxin component YwqK of YwqJK toxin-antitoxin module
MPPFDVLGVIARTSINAYRALLSLPRFARASLSSDHQYRYRAYYLVHEIKDNGFMVYHEWYIPSFPKHITQFIKILHRSDGPAYYGYYKNGKPFFERWMYFGLAHSIVSNNGELLPSYISWHENGKLKCVQWYSYNQLHRLNEPATIDYDTNGEICRRKWYFNGQYHRMDGPAVLYETNSRLNEYWLYGKQIDKDQYNFMRDCMYKALQL